jgi:hypothetical protein
MRKAFGMNYVECMNGKSKTSDKYLRRGRTSTHYEHVAII